MSMISNSNKEDTEQGCNEDEYSKYNEYIPNDFNDFLVTISIIILLGSIIN